ncbi:armadillo-type protein [Schizophyllum amplum]|uniref:Armadillo-type protein n=1 Tax=Schizophyllum amplum TaxID=97359 RepID=A0A550BYP7_9AGAR|nr:armadillo-type protein [Auriculariopsis ampla]
MALPQQLPLSSESFGERLSEPFDERLTSDSRRVKVFLLYSHSAGVREQAVWALGNIAGDGRPEDRRMGDEQSLPPHERATRQCLSLKNITASSNDATDTVVVAGALPALVSLLTYPDEAVRRDAALALSNVTAGPPAQIQAAFNAGAVPPLIRALAHGDPALRKEACWALAKAAAGAPTQVRFLVAEGLLEPLCGMLSMGDARITLVVLDALSSVLRVKEMDWDPDDPWALNQYALLVFNLAYHIMSTYFSELDDDF